MRESSEEGYSTMKQNNITPIQKSSDSSKFRLRKSKLSVDYNSENMNSNPPKHKKDLTLNKLNEGNDPSLSNNIQTCKQSTKKNRSSVRMNIKSERLSSLKERLKTPSKRYATGLSITNKILNKNIETSSTAKASNSNENTKSIFSLKKFKRDKKLGKTQKVQQSNREIKEIHSSRYTRRRQNIEVKHPYPSLKKVFDIQQI